LKNIWINQKKVIDKHIVLEYYIKIDMKYFMLC
jgi:hypothetical protein